MSLGKTIRRIAIGLAILIVVAVIAGYFVLRSAGFHRYVIAQVDQKIEQATGGRAEIASYSFDLRPLVITVNHLVVHGTEPPGALPLFQTDRIVLGLKLVSLLHGKVDITDIEVDHPIANLMVDRNSQTNVPHPQTQSSSSTSVWDLGIQHLLISNGEIYYSSKATPLNADLHDLLTRAQYDNQQQRFVGDLSYRRGHLQFGSYTPIAHDLDSHFTVSPSGMTFEPLVLRVASSELTVRTAVQNYSQPSMNGSYRLALHTEDVRRVLRNSSLPLGIITVSGSLLYQNIPGRPPLETVVSKGELNCPQLLLETPTLRGALYRISGAYDVANGNLSTHNLRADLLGGQLNANLNVRDVAVRRVSSLRASLKGISIQEAARVMRSMQSPPLTGRADADMQANWHGSMQGLRALLNASLNAAITPSRSKTATPLTGVLHAVYTDQDKTFILNQAQLQTPSTLIQMSGPIGDRSNLQLRANSSNLHELEALALALKPPASASNGSQPSQPPSIFGSASLNANLQGSLKQPRVTGRLNSQSLQIEDTHWRTLEAGFAASPSGISVQRGSLVSAGPGSIQFDADVNLRDWRYLPSDPLSAHLYVNRMPADQLTHLAKLSYPITGTLSAQVSIHGSQLAPFGNGSVRLTQARVAGASIPMAAIDFSATGNAVRSTANATLAGGGINATLTYYPDNQGYLARVDVRQIHLEQIEKAQTLHISGLLSASATGRGTLHDPQLSATASIPQLQVNQKTISGIGAQLEVANQSASFQVNSNIAQSFVQARGTVALTGDKYATLQLDSKGIALQTLLAAYMTNPPPQGFQGELELHATANGPLSKPTQMQAQLQVPVFTASYGQVHIGAVRPIVAEYRSGVVTLQPSEIKGTGTDIKLEGMVPVQGSRPASFSANGGIDLSLLHLINSQIISQGRIELDVHAVGAATAPGVQGQVRLVNATFSSLDTPMGVENVNGVFAITNNEIQIQNFAGEMGGGQFTASGTVAYRPQTQFNVSLKANHVRLLYPEGLRTILQSDLLLAGNTQSAELSGRVLLDSMSFAQGFDLASFVSQTSSASSGAEPEQGFAQNLHLNIALQSANDLGLSSSQVSLQGSVNLRVSGTAADPVILGRADITRGELFFIGKRYQIQRGIAQFNNPTHTEPVLNFLVTTKVNQYDISLSLMGPLDRLRTHYVSDPPLPPVDIINLLARGQTTEEAAAAPANLGANQVIASGLAGQVSGQIQKLAGISSLQIDPLIGGNNQNPGARLSIQQRVTKNFFFTYSTDVTSTQDQIVQGEYQFTKHWSGSLVRDQFGNIGVDAKYRKTF